MSVVRFIDTNVLVYSHDRTAGWKQSRAVELQQEWWRRPDENAVSVQVLQELQVNLVRKGLDRLEANSILRSLYAWRVVENSKELLEASLSIQARWQLSLWDALIIAAAQASGASELISEDFNHGQDYDGVVARNPFVQV